MVSAVASRAGLLKLAATYPGTSAGTRAAILAAWATGRFADPRKEALRLAKVERTYHPDRLKYPMKRVSRKGEGRFERITWDEAIAIIARRFQAIADSADGQPSAPAFAGSSTGQWLLDHAWQYGFILTPAETDAGKAQNRRTEFHIAELDGKRYLGRDPQGGGKLFQ